MTTTTQTPVSSASAGMGRSVTMVFTGTRKGMKARQAGQVFRALERASRLIHGGAAGADEQVDALYPFAQPEGLVTVFPGGDDPLARNRQMVGVAMVLPPTVVVAAPAGMAEELRSGTWACVRYARKQGLPVYICWPDGTTRWEPEGVR